MNKLKIISKDKYQSEKLLTPRDEGTKELYFKIYEEYVMGHLTEKQLADKYGYTVYHVSRIIKWVTFQLGDPDPDAQLRVMIDKLKLRQQEMEIELQNAKTSQDKVLLWQEMRRTDTLIAKLQGLLSNSLIDMSDRRQINVLMNKVITERRAGVSTDEKDEK